MAVYYDEDDEREYYEFEPLPTLLEDEENVSLADVLSLRDSCLNEQDIWAACLECCSSMKSITHTPLFHTLCITPDTLAFNANGNVCFMEQLSDDPEGAFVPPEFDDTGNTFEAHIYSLGATLTAAAEYVIEPELELDLSQELRNLLDQMQQEKPEDRPDIERILSKCEEKTKRSSDIICRNLSAIGRRVLSIESVSALPDECEYTWKVKKRQAGVGYEVQTSERNPADGSSSTEDLACDRSILNDGTAEVIYRAENYDYDVDKNSTELEVNEIFQQGLEYPSSAEICDRKKTELDNDPAETVLDLKNNGSNVSMDLSSAQKRPVTKKRILPKLPTEMEDRPQYFYPKSGILVTPNPSPLSLSLYFDSAQEFFSLRDAASIRNPVEWPQKLQFRTKNNAVSFVENNSLASIKLNIPDIEAVSKSSCIPTLGRFRELSPTSPSTSGSMSWNKNLKNEVSTMHESQMGSPTSNGILFKEGPVFGNGRRNSLGAEENYFHCIHSNVPVEERVTGSHHRCDFKQRRSTSVSDLSAGNIKLFGNMTQHNQEDEPRTPLDSTENNCANFTNDRQYFSLQDILSVDDKTLKDHELWSLCHECLTSLQLGKDYPAYLCLESVYIDCSGKVLFVTNPSKGTFDSFYLAPEFEKQSIVTEKVCVYGVAAILWTAAKFNAPANEKLSLSRSLKKLLLSMAKRNSAERPSVKEVLKICNDYLVHRGIVSRKILTLLRNTVLQNQHKEDAFVSEMEFQTEEIKPFHSPLGNIDCTQESARLGFVPLAGDSKLTAVKGPIPCQYSVNSKSPSKLPEAFTSPATHFKPIILTQHKEKTSTKMPAKTSTAKQLVKAMKHEIQKNKEMVSVKDIENDIVMEKSTTDFGTESLENNPNGSIHLVSSGQIVSPSDVSHTIEGKKDNISTTLSQAQKANSSFCCSAVSTFTANNNILHQNSKSRMRTSTPIQLEIPQQDVSSEDKIKSYFPEPALLLNKESDRHSGDSFKFVTFPLQDTSTHMIGSNEDLKATNKRFPGTDLSNDAFNGSVDTEDVASQSPLSNKCLFTQETLGTGIQAKTFAPVPHFTDISDDVHMPSSHILSCSLEPHMAIKSSSSDPICLLQKIVHLIQEEFAFDGYLENGEEARAMGEYILSLNRLKFGTFTNAISEKFCDLYWDEKLLEQLYEVVNGDPPPLSQFAVWSNTGCSGLTLPKMNKKNTQLPIHGTERSKDIQENNLLVAEEKIADIDDTLSDHLYSVTGDEDQLHNNTEVIPGHDVNSIISDAMDFKETAPDISKEEGTLFQIASKQPVEACTISENLTERYNEKKEETDSYTTEVLEARVSVALCPTLSTVEKKSCNPGWSSAFFGMECFNQDVKTYVKQLGQHNSSETQNIEAKMLELDQQLMMEMKDFRKTKTFYQKLQQQERRNKGTDTKIVLPKLKEQLEEVKLKVEFLELAKKYLEVLHMELWGLNSSVLPSLVSSSSQIDMLELKSADLNSLLTFHSLKEDQSQSKIRLQLLQAGTTVGLMAYLYNSNAVIEGYVQQFFYTFRYFISPSDFFQFLNDRFDSAAHISLNQKRSTDCIKVLNRTLDLLQAWVEECYNVDFAQDIELLHKLETFISTKAIPYGDRGQHLVNLLHNCSEDKMVRKLSRLSFSAEDMKIEEDIQSLHSFSKKLSEENISRKSFKWKISKGSESTSPQHKERYYSIAAALPRPCYSSFAAELSGSSQKLDEKGLSMLTENSPQHIAQQLTLLQQELFQDCHPVHFLNSRALGVNDKSSTVTKSVSPEPMVIEGNSLFVPEYRQDQHLIQLIKYAENVGNWVSAEIVNCDTSKTQSGLITKCLLMAKCCYEWRNFATAMQILSGLENLIVRQLPTWKNLPSKALEIMEELTAVQVFLKSDSLCLMEGDSFRKQPTIPCACILAMHAQQVEIGAFTMANGTYKWPKLRKIAKVVSQIRAFQENPYVFAPDSEMQMYLRQRISHFSEVDIHVLAAENKTNFYQPSNEMHSRKIQDTLRKVKATFQ